MDEVTVAAGAIEPYTTNALESFGIGRVAGKQGSIGARFSIFNANLRESGI